MKNFVLFVLLLVAVGLGAFSGYSVWQSLPGENAVSGELDWLRQEFDLDAEQFSKVQELHAEYRPICDALCARVLEAQKRLDEKLLAATSYNEEIEEDLAHYSRVKEDCHRAMLQHLYEVAAVMNPDQRHRYLIKAKAQVTMHDRPYPLPDDPLVPSAGDDQTHP